MAKRDESIIRYVGRNIWREAKRQIKPRQIPKDVIHQATSCWGQEFARQMFGTSRRRRRG